MQNINYLINHLPNYLIANYPVTKLPNHAEGGCASGALPKIISIFDETNKSIINEEKNTRFMHRKFLPLTNGRGIFQVYGRRSF